LEQLVAPELAMNIPAEQFIHAVTTVAATVAKYCPAGQSVHRIMVVKYLPAGHAVQLLELEAV